MPQHPYICGEYAAAFAESLPDRLGVLTVSARSGAPCVRRVIGRGDEWDLAGPYPFLPWDDSWSPAEGVAELRRSGAVSVVLLTDPVHRPSEAVGGSADVLRAFKRHHLIEVARGYRPCAHHQAELRKAAQRGVEVKRYSLSDLLDPWVDLYARFIAPRTVEGALHRFSRGYHQAVAQHGAELWTCWLGEELVAAAIWVRFGPVAYYHLAAANDRGRSASAGYVAVDAAVRALLAEGVEVVVLGSGLSRQDALPCSLERFKAGFGTDAKTNFIIGYVLDPVRYRHLAANAVAGYDYFPAYRSPVPRRSAISFGDGQATGIEPGDGSRRACTCSEAGVLEGDALLGRGGPRSDGQMGGVVRGGMRTIWFLTPTRKPGLGDVYGVLRTEYEEVAAAFRDLGLRAIFADAEMPEFLRTVLTVGSASQNVLFGHLFYDMTVVTGGLTPRPLADVLPASFVSYVGDHPIAPFMRTRVELLHHCRIAFVFEPDFIDQIRMLNPEVRVFRHLPGLSFGVRREEPKPSRKRAFDVVVAFRHKPPVRPAPLEQALTDPVLGEALTATEEVLVDDCSRPLFAAFSESLAATAGMTAAVLRAEDPVRFDMALDALH